MDEALKELLAELKVIRASLEQANESLKEINNLLT